VNSDLIIMTFPQQDKARQARQALEMMRGKKMFGLKNTVIVTRGQTGRAVVDQRWELPTYPQGPGNALPVLFANACFGGASESDAGALVEAGLDPTLLTDVAAALKPGGSALLMYYPADSIVDIRKLLDTLAMFQGTLHHTTIPPRVEQSLVTMARNG
jgi:uncharacterized membrane protein